MGEHAPRLSINVDHVATLRQARRESEPDPVHAAVLCEAAGADGITVHLREDRRHINDRDVRVLREVVRTRLNLEMAATDEMVQIACDLGPEQATLVPERREELTTEGGLDVIANQARITETLGALTANGIYAGIFIEPEADQIAAAADCGAQAVELHAGPYANAHSTADAATQLARLARGAEAAAEHGLALHAGHGLTYGNVGPVVRLPNLVEVSIGHNIVARAVLVGMDVAVRDMRAAIAAALR